MTPLNFNTTPLFILKCHTNFLLIIEFSTIYAYLVSIFLESNLKLKIELLNLVSSVSYLLVHCLYFISSFILLYNLSLSIELTTISSIAFLYAYNGRVKYHANKITLECNSYAIATLTIFLIIICNTFILNPGLTNKTEGLTCFYQNIQGLVTFGSIGNPHPDLNITKISELQSYIFDSSPDIIILNETWLKPCINNKEIIPGKFYKILRNDRCLDSHPLDPQNPGKFRRNGGGILAAIKEGLNLNPKLIKVACKAEILSIELSLPNK